MCQLCIEETGVALAALFTMFPFLKARVMAWRRARKMRRMTQLGRWA